jgi:hypothetical protein
MRGVDTNTTKSGEILKRKIVPEREVGKKSVQKDSAKNTAEENSLALGKENLPDREVVREERLQKVQGLPLDIHDPLSRNSSFSYILTSTSVSDLQLYPLKERFEFLLWHDEDEIDIDFISGYRGILYNKGEPLALVAYDETEEAFVLYTEDPLGQLDQLLAMPTRKGGVFLSGKRKKAYRYNPARALAQDLNDSLVNDIELERREGFDPIAALFNDPR